MMHIFVPYTCPMLAKIHISFMLIYIYANSACYHKKSF